ncbi:trkA C-terminal domain protein [Clostridium sp. CAG:299]|mgnify:FL=1|nr:trkA C-terminal domain protein [Clostridium sp. CAG:299]
MNEYLILIGTVIAICVLLNRFAQRLPIPSLLIFIALGMCFGVNGIVGIPFDDYQISEQICSVCLLFVMFYGGFGTNLKAARPAAAKAVVLSTAGVVATAGLVGIFAHFALKLEWLESFLIGSVIASTDAASVFSVLKTQKLDLKDHTASLLEIESGSNDPFSYMLTVLFVSLLQGESISVPALLANQILVGAAAGLLIGYAAVFFLKKCDFYMEQGKTIFVFAAAALAYALPSVFGGNGYLSVYICGIYMGNAALPDKKDLVHFFDAVTGIAQMMIFFLLGLLVTPSELPETFLPALLIMLFLTFIARPLAAGILLAPMGSGLRQIGVVSWAGLRGVASIVFAIYAVLGEIELHYNLFNLVFCIVILSLGIQGTLLPRVSSVLDMIDRNQDVRRTFNDYQEDNDVSFVKLHVSAGHRMAGKALKELPLAPDFLAALLLRGKETLVPNGETVVEEGDLLILAAEQFEDRENLSMSEICLDKNSKWAGKSLSEIRLPKGSLIVLIQREGKTLIPGGSTVLQAGDCLAVARLGAETGELHFDKNLTLSH